jgi:LmbE family N-acetylglucosaminyl deacetylase
MHALKQRKVNPIQGRNILLVIAHPDDEVMFFGPTLIGITSDNSVRVLCLSNGTNLEEKSLCRECGWNWGDTRE